MKRIAAILSVVAITTITIVSCSKKGDYTCTCTLTVAGQTVSSNGGTWNNVKKSDAQKQCDAANSQMQTTATAAGGSGSCTLN